MFKLLHLLAALTPASAARLSFRDTVCSPGAITVNDRQCTIECGTDHAGGDYSALSVPNFQGCIDACIADANCKTAQYLTTNSYCYLKSAIGGSSSNDIVNGIICPDQASTTTTTTTTTTAITTTTSVTAAASCVGGPVTINGRSGSVECDADRAGGDYTNTYAQTFADCENACASDTKCLTAQYVVGSKMCYLKSAANSPSSKTGIWGIVFGTTVSSSTTRSATTTAVTTISTISTILSTTTSSITSSTVATTTPTTTTAASTTPSSSTTSTTTANQYACTPGYATLNGRKAVVQCGVDYPGGSYKTQYTGNFDACEAMCAADAQCAVATYDYEQGYCYLKSQASPSPSRYRAHAVKFLPTTTATPGSRCTAAAPDSPFLLNGGFERDSLDFGEQKSSFSATSKGSTRYAINQSPFEGCKNLWVVPDGYPDTADPQFAGRMYNTGLTKGKQYVLTFILGSYPNSYPGSNTTMSFKVYNTGGYSDVLIGQGDICTNSNNICQLPDYDNYAQGRFYSFSFVASDNGNSLIFVINWKGSSNNAPPAVLDDVRINLPGDAPTAPAKQTS